MAVIVEDFGFLADKKIEKYTIENSKGTKASFITYGAAWTNLFAPDKNGKFADILVGFDNMDGFVNRTDYQGVIVGPFANRVGNSEITIDSVKYKLTPNENETTCLHSDGEFNTAVWNAEIIGDNAVEFSYTSPDGLNGFPGNIVVRVKYTLTDNDELKLEYYAMPDKKTVINLTNHAYFNLGGFDSGDILGHVMKINADKYIPIDALSIPTGEIADVKDTPMDLRNGEVIGDKIDADFEQLTLSEGFDHNYCINGYDGTLKKAAEVYEPVSGRTLEVLTTLPGVQFYAGNFLNGAEGKDGKPINKRSGFCLETQFWPDTPNQPNFPQCIFDKGEAYKSETVFVFSVK